MKYQAKSKKNLPHLIIAIFKNVNERRYLFIPMCCIFFWAFISLMKDNFIILGASDFKAIYYAAQYIFVNPELVYSDAVFPPYPYTPCIATLFAPIAYLSFEAAHWLYFIITLILSFFLILNFDQILKIKNVENKLCRLLFLLAISNGLIYVQLFDYLTSKMWTACFLIYFLRRELEYRELNKDRNSIKYKFTQWMILLFAIGISPQMGYLIFLYLFYNIKFKELFTKNQIQNYILVIIVFFIQNFMFIVIFIVSPEGILYFFGGSYRGRTNVYTANLSYDYLVKNKARTPTDTMSQIFYVLSLNYNLSALNFDLLLPSLIIMSFITIIIYLNKKLKIEEKFGFLSLFSLFFHTMLAPRYYIVLLPLIVLLLIDKIEKFENFIDFLKNNLFLLLSLVCVIILYFMPEIYFLVREFPFISNIPIAFLILRNTFVYIPLTLMIYKLYQIKNKKLELETTI